MELLPHIKIRQEQFGVIIFDKEREKFFVADEVGKDVLAAIQSSQTVDDAVEQLTQKYEASRQAIKRDVLSFLEQLRQAGLM